MLPLLLTKNVGRGDEGDRAGKGRDRGEDGPSTQRQPDVELQVAMSSFSHGTESADGNASSPSVEQRRKMAANAPMVKAP